MTNLAKLKAAYEAYNARLREHGVPLLSYTAPCCGATLESRAANPGEIWDTTAQCPECGDVYYKISTATRIRADIFDPENVPAALGVLT